MSDFWTAALISGSWVLLALGIAHGKDAAKLAWTAMKQRKTKRSHVFAAWPSDTMPVCQSWLGREITAPVIAEAEGIIVRRWQELIAEQIEESNDDRSNI